MKDALLTEINSSEFEAKLKIMILNRDNLTKTLNTFCGKKNLNLKVVYEYSNSSIERNLLRYAKQININVVQLTCVNIACRYLVFWGSLIGDYEMIKEGNGNGLDLLSLVESVNDHHNEIEIINELNQVFNEGN